MDKSSKQKLTQVTGQLSTARHKLEDLKARIRNTDSALERNKADIEATKLERGDVLRQCAEGTTTPESLTVVRKRLTELEAKQEEIVEYRDAMNGILSEIKKEVDTLEAERSTIERHFWLSVAEDLKGDLRKHTPELLKVIAAFRLADRNAMTPQAIQGLFFGPENGHVHDSPYVEEFRPIEEELRKKYL